MGESSPGRREQVITSETLSDLYQAPIEVLRTSDGRLVVVGQPEAPAHHSDRHAHGTTQPQTPMNPHLSLDPISDVHQLLVYPFMVNALEAGTTVAVMASVVGWFMVLRRQTFAGHTLSIMSFPGASAAALAGDSSRGGVLRLLHARSARPRRRFPAGSAVTASRRSPP